MAIGMTYEQFWDGDPEMAPDFRRAWEVKQDLSNQAAWLQGMYFYEALCDVAPIFRALSKAKKPLPYTTEPYDFNTPASEARKEDKQERSMQAAKAGMETFMVNFNKRFEKPETKASEVSADGGCADSGN